MTFDLRLLTGPSSAGAGGGLSVLRLRLWLTNRRRLVYRLAKHHLTPAGIEGVIGLRLLLTVLGGYFATAGAASVRFWYLTERQLYDPVGQPARGRERGAGGVGPR